MEGASDDVLVGILIEIVSALLFIKDTPSDSHPWIDFQRIWLPDCLEESIFEE